MKNSLKLLLPLLAGMALCLSVSANQSDKLRLLAQAKAPDAKIERRVTIRHGGPARELEKVAFLGVETAPVPPVLTAQLGLPANAGLVVRSIVPDSPAAGALERHDVLLKLDDQLLIEPRQFSVLVRNHKEGDEVTLTYVRAGKQATAKVKLGLHEVPQFSWAEWPGTGEGGADILIGTDEAPAHAAEMGRVLSLLDRGDTVVHARRFEHGVPSMPGLRATAVNTGNSNMVFTDQDGALELTAKDGKKSLVAKNAKGETIFSGPIDTAEQRKALPADVAARLERIEGMREFSFEVPADFEAGVRTMPAQPSKISLPLPARPAHPAHLPAVPTI